jgi:hypothetical protein
MVASDVFPLSYGSPVLDIVAAGTVSASVLSNYDNHGLLGFSSLSGTGLIPENLDSDFTRCLQCPRARKRAICLHEGAYISS